MEGEQPWEMSEGGTVEDGQANRIETVHAEGLCSSRVGCASEISHLGSFVLRSLSALAVTPDFAPRAVSRPQTQRGRPIFEDAGWLTLGRPTNRPGLLRV